MAEPVLAKLGAPRQVDWSLMISCDEAAKLLDITPRAMRRRAADELARKGLAYHGRPPGSSSRAGWWIDRRADERLVESQPIQQQTLPTLDHYSTAARQRAFERLAAVERFREAQQLRPGLQRDWLPTLIKELQQLMPELRISRTSLLRWHADYRQPSDLVKLIDHRAGNPKTRGDGRAWKRFQDLYLDQRQPTIADCWRAVKADAAANGWEWCSLRSCQNQVNERIDPELQCFHREPKKWKNQMRPGIVQSSESWAAGQLWIGDHKQLDLWCIYGKRLVRPWLTAWMDWRTRRMVGWVLAASPDSATIHAALRHGLTDDRNMGGPGMVAIDNGRDYDCTTFHGQTKKQRQRKIKLSQDEPQMVGLYSLLGIKPRFAIPHNPTGKSRLERWFGETTRFARSFASYCGRNTDEKPEDIAVILKQRRNVPTFEHVLERITQFIAGYNARSDHNISDLVDQGESISPDQAMARWCPARRVIADARMLDLLQHMIARPVRVNSKLGIALNVMGKTYWYGQFDDRLSPYKAVAAKDRRWVHVTYDPHNVKSIRAYDDRWQFLGEFAMNEAGQDTSTTMGREQVSELMKRQRRYRSSLQTVQDNRELEYLSDYELIAEAQQPDPPTPTDRMKLIQPSFETPSNDDCEPVRMAAGGESIDPDADLDDRVAEALEFVPRMRRDDDDLPDIDLEMNMDASAASADDLDIDDELNMDVVLALTDEATDGDDDDHHILDSLP